MLEQIDYLKIGSSSKGNCILVQTKFMLDCGVTYKKISKYLKFVKFIFISHIHKDHLFPTTISKIGFNYPTIKFVTSSEEVVKKLISCNIPKKNIYYLQPSKWCNLGMIKLKTEPLAHDVENYCLKWEYEGKKGIYITDTADVDDLKAKNYDLYLIESNYNEDLLKEHIINCEDNNELYYLDRVARTHLSFEQANSFLIENMGSNSAFDYIHQSDYNFKEDEE